MTIRNVPPATRDRLADRAKRAGQSLQEYLRLELMRSAERPTTDEWLATVRSEAERNGSTVTAGEIVRVVREGRDRD